jgi:hypothetical protein
MILYQHFCLKYFFGLTECLRRQKCSSEKVGPFRGHYVGLVQLVSASSPSHQVLGSKPSVCRISAGVRLCFGYSLPQTPLVWEPLALGLPFIEVAHPLVLGKAPSVKKLDCRPIDSVMKSTVSFFLV